VWGQPPLRQAQGRLSAVRFAEGKLQVHFTDAVYGEQIKSAADIEDFALLRSDGMPTYHLASCADDADLRITHIIRGQDHLTNTFKHVLIFEAAGATPPQFAHLPLLVAPDGTKLSKRRHGPVVSVTTYRDAGFLPEACAIPASIPGAGRSVPQPSYCRVPGFSSPACRSRSSGRAQSSSSLRSVLLSRP